MPTTSTNHDWELAASTSSVTSTAPTIPLSGSEYDDYDDEEYDLESSLSLSLPTSDLEDEGIWQGLSDEGSFTESSSRAFVPASPLRRPSYRMTSADEVDAADVHDTPLQSVRPLAGEGEEESIDLDNTVSGVDPNDVSSSTSTFDFHFPDPLNTASVDLGGVGDAGAYEQLVRQRWRMRAESEGEESEDGGIGSMIDTDVVESVDRLLKRSTTILPSPPPSVTSKKSKTSFWRVGISMYVSLILPRANRMLMPFVCIFSALVLFWLSVYATRMKRSSLFDSIVPHHHESHLKESHDPWIDRPPPVDLVVEPPTIQAGEPSLAKDPSPSSDSHIPPRLPHVHFPPSKAPNENLTSVPSVPSFRPWNRVVDSLSHYYGTFSTIIFNDLREFARLLEELLQFLKSTAVAHAVQERSQTAMEYLMERMSHRHERAKRNAKVLSEKGLRFVRTASRELAVVQEVAVENARLLWRGVNEVVEGMRG
ncbi:hypothetical protein FRC17_009178 [Serendipita sp. 399]|nr:hypothetical protein FRC17_009178 [Serendipita sp. 399]